MIIGIVGRRGQMTVPREIRRSLNLEQGDRIAFIRSGDGVVLQPLTDTLLDLRGSVAVEGPQDFAEIRERVSSSFSDPPHVMVFNKIDLEHEREVEESDIEELAGQGTLVVRSSAKTGEGVEEAFLLLTKAIIDTSGGE